MMLQKLELRTWGLKLTIETLRSRVVRRGLMKRLRSRLRQRLKMRGLGQRTLKQLWTPRTQCRKRRSGRR